MTTNTRRPQTARVYLRWAAVAGLVPLPLSVLFISIGAVPWPESGQDGQAYLEYVLHNHVGEIQTICWMVIMVALMVWAIALAMFYIHRSGGPTASALAILLGTTAYAIAGGVAGALFNGVVLYARGNPSFGSDPADFRVIAFGWENLGMMFGMGSVLWVLAFAGVAAANRATPILPRALAEWCGIAIAVISVGSLGFCFAYRGPWSYGSIGHTLLVMAPQFAWLAAVSVALFKAARRAQ
ncbi:hypothetical protein B7P34_02520 [Streptosporangium nondiastaticum]|uniref:DUF4386 domain-containing protein n=1 Tax=Streptosporangium nondiastaticum TaxID=35764 RepID=A0A9X7JVE5_9ACTN|nr:hypothetical protein [Streptosporangium nondiastaticum]PSJ30436.1 hypothetical protein B7P34_02520 [Streptosporangium nondiastaticum]